MDDFETAVAILIGALVLTLGVIVLNCDVIFTP